MDTLLFHPTRIAQLADDVVLHLTGRVRPNGFQGMPVRKDRQAVK